MKKVYRVKRHVAPGALPVAADLTYEQEVAADGPVAWWKLDEASGTSAADSGSGVASNATINESVLYRRTGPTGFPYGMGFETNPDVVTTAADVAKISITGDFSVSAWIQYTGAPAELGGVFTCAYSGGTVPYALHFDTNGAGSSGKKPCFGWYNGAAWKMCVSADDISADAWHLIGGVYSAAGDNLKLYVDGVLKDTEGTVGTQPVDTMARYIGKRWDNSVAEEWWTGDIANVQVYNKALTEARFLAQYNAAT